MKRHKDFFITLEKNAEKNSDKSQNFIFNREILKCDHYRLKKIEPFWASLQDRLILWFGRWSSNHGVSLILPAFWLLLFNTILNILVFCIVRTSIFSIDFFHVFAEMFNPISSLANSLGKIGLNSLDDESSWVFIAISTINVAQKAIYAILLYELIRVGRRFVAK